MLDIDYYIIDLWNHIECKTCAHHKARCLKVHSNMSVCWTEDQYVRMQSDIAPAPEQQSRRDSNTWNTALNYLLLLFLKRKKLYLIKYLIMFYDNILCNLMYWCKSNSTNTHFCGKQWFTTTSALRGPEWRQFSASTHSAARRRQPPGPCSPCPCCRWRTT